ncbi:MAG: hypothetical protein G01um101413_304 [Parcubacteria group bacterium Gr01-1014_13]|nr:MAG: hypothetical protein G01um101413_304 [Parcubacteria group bacterium Gr01-1014_13]
MFLLLGSFFYFPKAVQAHSIEADGSVLVMLHASDDDNPIIGQPAELTFYITDSQKKFKASGCDCRLTITLNDSVIFSTTTFNNVKNNAVFSYTFPQKGIYTIAFTANPLVENGFQSFKFNYDMRVDRTIEQAIATETSRDKYRMYLVLAFGIILIAVFNYRRLKKSILGLFVVLLVFGTAFHQPQVLCPDHVHGVHLDQHECCFVPLIENNPKLIITPLFSNEARAVKLQQPVKIKIIFGLNNKSPPGRFV